MNLDSKGGVRAAFILAGLAILAVIAFLYGLDHWLHFAKFLGELD